MMTDDIDRSSWSFPGRSTILWV